MKNKTIFQSALGNEWTQLGDIIQRHYFLKPFSDDSICVRGTMDEIHHSNIAKILIPGGLLFGAIVPYRRQHVPVDVHYQAHTSNANLYWDRVFAISPSKNFHFKSYMEVISDKEVIEFVRFGVGIKLTISAEDKALIFRGNGYIWRIARIDIPIPLGFLLGDAYVEERPIDDHSFSMKLRLTHPWFGTLFRYSGTFRLLKNTTT